MKRRGFVKTTLLAISFLLTVVDQYYKVAVGAVKKYDPNHLILGDKFNGNTHTPAEIIGVSSRYTELVYYQMYGHYEEQHPLLDQWSASSGKPIYNGDGAFSVPSEKLPHPNGPHCKTQEERARASLDFARQAFARPDFVGWDHCGWMDSWKTFPGQQDRQLSGLQNPFGNHYQPMVEAFQELIVGKYKIKEKSLY